MSDHSTRLLIQEPPLLVIPTLAVALGLNEAIFLQQVHYWLQKSPHLHDGHRWIYNTYDEWERQLPFWSARTIRRIVGGLEELGIIVSSQAFNTSPLDKTKWYRIDYPALDRELETRLPKRSDEAANVASSGTTEAANLATWSASSGQMDADRLATSSSGTETTPQRENSKGPATVQENWSVVDTSLLERFIVDFSREFGDEAPVPASVARAARIWARAGVDQTALVTSLYEARRRTKERTGSIEKRRGDGNGKNKMPYFFEVLEDLLGLRS